MRMPTAVITFALALASIAGASADNYPSKQVTIVVPFPAGGPTDTVARILADHMKDTLGQPMLVENVTGAGATIGARPRRRRRAGWLHDHRRQLVRVCRVARDLSGVLEPAERFRADRAAAGFLAHDRRQDGAAGQQCQGTDRLAEGEPGQGHGRQCRRRLRRACLRPLLHGQDADQFHLRAVPRRSSRDAGSDRQPDRPDVRGSLPDTRPRARLAR